MSNPDLFIRPALEASGDLEFKSSSLIYRKQKTNKEKLIDNLDI